MIKKQFNILFSLQQMQILILILILILIINYKKINKQNLFPTSPSSTTKQLRNPTIVSQSIEVKKLKVLRPNKKQNQQQIIILLIKTLINNIRSQQQVILSQMNYLSIPRQGPGHTQQNMVTQLSSNNQNFFRKDSFMQSNREIPIGNVQSSYKLLPYNDSMHIHSSAYLSYTEEISNRRQEFEQLKQTLALFKNSLQQAEYGEQRNITERTEFSFIIKSLFTYLKQIMKSSHDIQNFDWVFQNYIYVLKRKENSQHFFTQVQSHLKEILNNSQLAKFRKSRKVYIFLSRLFPYCPHTVYKILQNKAEIFDNQSPYAIQVYKSFVRFASEKSHNSTLLSHIKTQISKQSTSIQKLTILLTYYKEKLSLQLIISIQKKIDQLVQSFNKYWKQTPNIQKQLVQMINQFLSLQWPPQGKKYQIIIKYINNWDKQKNHQTEKYINKFLKNMPSIIDNKQIIEQIHTVLYGYIMNKLLIINSKVQKSTQSRKAHNKDFNQTFIFLNFLFQKCGKNVIQTILEKPYFKKTFQNLISEPFPLKDGLIGMLSTLKKLNVHNCGIQIQSLLIDKMKTILSSQKGVADFRRYSQIFQKQIKKMQQSNRQSRSIDDLFYCIKALRYFSFNYESFWNIYSMIKRYIFKKNIVNQYGFQFKKQVVKACLYIISKLSKPQECMNILQDAIDIIGQQEQLKCLYIEWSALDGEFYRKKLYQIYNSPEYLQNLIHDYSSKNIVIKRFSVKMLCLLYPYNQCQIIPFLKKTYYQIYERLSVDDMVDFSQKRTGLKLIRQIIKSRSQIVKDDCEQFCAFLYRQFCQTISQKYHHHMQSQQHNQLIVEILKTLIQITKVMKESIFPYIRSIGFHLISLINSKVTSPDIKRYCLETFTEIAFNCGYVIIPYFYHRNLLVIFREILKSDDRNHLYRNQLMRFMGSLGFVSREKFYRLRRLTDGVQEGGGGSPEMYAMVQAHFQKTFKQITYLRKTKQSIEALRQWKQTRGFCTKQYSCISQIKPLPSTSPYYSDQKVSFRVTSENFNYKKQIIEKILQNMNQQSSSIVIYNTFKTLQCFIFLLPKSQQKMYQQLVFSKIQLLDSPEMVNSSEQQGNSGLSNANKPEKPKSQKCNPTSPAQSSSPQKYSLTNMLSLLRKLIYFQDFKLYVNELFHYFSEYIHKQQKRTIILQCLFVVTSNDIQLLTIDIKKFILSLRKIVLDLYKRMNMKQVPSKSYQLLNNTTNTLGVSPTSETFDKHQAQHHILLSFGILTNLSKYLDNYLHLFLPDFNSIFISRPLQICETYFSLLLSLFQKCPCAQQFLSEVSDHMFQLLKNQLTQYRLGSKAKQLNASTKSVLPSSTNSQNAIAAIPFINNLIDFLISALLIFGDKFKGFAQNFHQLIRATDFSRTHIFYQIVQDFMKKNSSFNYLHYAFTTGQVSEIMRLQKPRYLQLRTQQQVILAKKMYRHESLVNYTVLNQLIETFNCDQNQVQQQSQQWFTMLSLSIYQKSQDPFIRACSPIIKQDKTLSSQLFPLAFYFFWNILNTQFRRRLTMKIKNILENKGISLRVKQKFIDTIYYMEQQQHPVPVTDRTMRDASEEVLDLAKSLFYMEKLFYDDPESEGEKLIKTYAELGQSQSAVGLLGIVQNLPVKAKIQLYQKLNRCRQALKIHQDLKDKTKLENLQLQIKIRKDMFEWDTVLNKIQKLEKHKSKLAHYAVQSAINLGKWDNVKKHLPNVDPNHQKSNLWKAMLSIKDKKYQDVQKYIKKDRELIYPKICQLFNFSFQRKMQGVIRLQTLTELQEANEYLKTQMLVQKASEQEKKKMQFSINEKKKLIDTVWNDRIQGANTNLWSMQQLLLSRSLLFTKGEDLQNWLNYCMLALKQNQPQLCKKTLESLALQLKSLEDLTTISKDKRKKYKFLIQSLMIECKFLLGDAKDQEAVLMVQKLLQEKSTSGSHHQMYYKCALWLSQKQYDFTLEKAKKSIVLLNNALKDFKTYIKGWHLLGLMHNKIIQMLQVKKVNIKQQLSLNPNSKQTQRRMSMILSSSKDIDQAELSNLNTTIKPVVKDKDSREHDSKELIKQLPKQPQKPIQKDPRQYHISQALKCFIQSVSCGVKNHQFFLQDCLKIMNIVFTQHQVQGVVSELMQQYERIPSQGLIQIIPQIVGRLDVQGRMMLLEIMKKLLIHIGKNHPQAIVFPLIFCKKSGNMIKKQAAQQVLFQITKKDLSSVSSSIESSSSPSRRGHAISPSKQILNSAQSIAEQLIKVSLKLNQKFYININKIYQTSRDKGVCLKSIATLYVSFIWKILQEKSSQLSMSQFGFLQQYRQEFKDIHKKLLLYLDLNQTQMFKKAQKKIGIILAEIKKALDDTKKIYLEEVSPVLHQIKNSKVCLFGSYNPYNQPIYISHFKTELQVISSKQRPKKLILTGSNNKDYNFLLKGKQDLRLDERIMQLFSLINKMFHDPSQRQNYSIMGYSITPISLEIGIISWVQNCDTIGELIMKKRSSGQVYIQRQLSRQICQYYHILPRAQKVQIYKQIQQKVSGCDLRDIFWTRSSSSQEWLKARTCYIRSLAVMSIVGYIIGLGDRHPNNIMIQRDTGQIIHIDFGDCFDVNKMRKDFPQRVPFRLTRMLVKAMQPCGVHGIFKHTCQKIIKLLRANKESIIAIVQAFKYDPLIGWRFVKKDEGNQNQGMLQHSFDENDISILNKVEDKLNGQKREQRKPAQRRQSKNVDFALHILNQIKKKLNGRLLDDSTKVMTPEQQVQKLISEATSPQNLVQHYEGWQIYW